MERLNRWLARRAQRHARRLSIEAALLGGRYLRYAARRLTAFFVVRGTNTFAHVVEFTILLNLFSQRGLLTSVALSNAAAVVDAFWWGALEELRRKLRNETPSAGSERIRSWLSRAIKLALVAVLVAPALSLWRWWGGEEITALDGYAAVVGLRLAADIVVRTYYSGVYAHRRVYRPIALMMAIEPIGVCAVALSWRWLGEWSFPVGLMATTLVSQGVSLHYTLRAYRVLRVPLPLVRLRAPRRAPATDWREVFSAGAANLSSRIGSTLVLAGVLRVGLGSGRIDPFTFLLHLTSPLLGGASSWGRLFYHDWMRLRDDLHGALRRQLDRRLPATAVVVGLGLWAQAVGWALLLVNWRPMRMELLSLLPLMLSLAYLAARQLREFALGDFRRVTLASLFLCASVALALMVGGPSDAGRWNVLLGAAVAAAALALVLLGNRRPPLPTGRCESLFAWHKALAAVPGAVQVSWVRIAAGRVDTLAERLVGRLGQSGAVVASRGRILWFERAPGTLDARTLVVMSAGTVAEWRPLPQAPDGKSALEQLLELEAAAATPPAALAEEFRRAFPEGMVVDLARGASDLWRLGDRDRRLVWADALRVARRGHRQQPRSRMEVTAFHPSGEIRLVFVASRDLDAGARAAWRRRLEAAHWHAAKSQNRVA